MFSSRTSIALSALATCLAFFLYYPALRVTPIQVVTSCTVPGTAALTFDDGPYSYIYDISTALLAHNATGTFFFNGDNYGCIYDEENVQRVKYALNKGHQIASHTWAHKDLATLTKEGINDEMQRVDDALMKIAGIRPAFMRPPFGSSNDLVREISTLRGQVLALWDFDSTDWNSTSADEQKSRLDTLIVRQPSTVLSLQHETHFTTATDVLPYYIKRLQAAGYRLVTLAECTGLPAYQLIEAPREHDVGPRQTITLYDTHNRVFL
ncbi:carbohydrate esterase family 4 protein [Macrolepiota fuliginosa MF-IS2]|uniref:Carbohydrate esterase family 4 protein n=1 Tax=Macrolepiota fuliginosa MF-IS2 TaxID=1400762 RepID=A0A9P6C5K3_9AGAR|nr:carbohydrate esterase family 4 protein [Macrolepiota fuliginosa MF-IS2]